jgi:cobalamin biosynthesis protein CobD/CbiB
MIETWIGILAAYLLDRYVPAPTGFRTLNWYHDWTESVVQRADESSRRGPLLLLMALGPVCAGVLVLQLLFNAWSPLLGWMFGVLVLFLCLDLQAINLGDGESVDTADSLLERGGHILAVFTGYALFGAFGAVTLRLAQALTERWVGEEAEEPGERARSFYGYLYWLPARFAVLGYALAGRFQETAAALRARPDPWGVDPEMVPICGRASLGCSGGECDPADAAALVWRSLYVWMALLGVAALAAPLG